MSSWLNTACSSSRSPALSMVARVIAWLIAMSGLLLMARALADALDSWLIGLVVAGVAALAATSITQRSSSRVPGARG